MTCLFRARHVTRSPEDLAAINADTKSRYLGIPWD